MPWIATAAIQVIFIILAHFFFNEHFSMSENQTNMQNCIHSLNNFIKLCSQPYPSNRSQWISTWNKQIRCELSMPNLKHLLSLLSSIKSSVSQFSHANGAATGRTITTTQDDNNSKRNNHWTKTTTETKIFWMKYLTRCMLHICNEQRAMSKHLVHSRLPFQECGISHWNAIHRSSVNQILCNSKCKWNDKWALLFWLESFAIRTCATNEHRRILQYLAVLGFLPFFIGNTCYCVCVAFQVYGETISHNYQIKRLRQFVRL